jgi:DNA-binding NtrC family response regulator
VRRVNTRIVAATNRPLTRLVEQRLFRSDLYYRLSGVEVTVPPLRERADDILELARYFLERHRSTRALTMSAAAQEALRAYQWPGNVRELQRVLERAVALAETDSIELDDLPPQVRGEFAEILWPSLERGDSLRSWGTRYAQLVFERCGRNKRTASSTGYQLSHAPQLSASVETERPDDAVACRSAADRGSVGAINK